MGCKRCGSSTTWEDCWDCGGDGEYSLNDDDGDEETYACHTCDGKGGFYICCSTPEWCEAHPLGQEAKAV